MGGSVDFAPVLSSSMFNDTFFAIKGTLLSVLDEVLTTKRRLQLRVRALTAQEIAVQLSFREPVYVEHVIDFFLVRIQLHEND